MIHRIQPRSVATTVAAQRTNTAQQIVIGSRQSLAHLLEAAKKSQAAAANMATRARRENTLGAHEGIAALVGELKNNPVARAAELDLWNLSAASTPELRRLPPAPPRPLQLYDVVEVTGDGASLPKGARGIVVNLHMKAARDVAGDCVRGADGSILRVPALAEVMVLSPRKMGEVKAGSLQILRLARR